MTTFDNRENAYENKWAHDAELAFQLQARRDRLLGLWAAARLGKSGDEAERYAKTIIAADLERSGDEDVIGKLVVDLAGTGTTEAEVRAALVDQTAEAQRQLAALR